MKILSTTMTLLMFGFAAFTVNAASLQQPQQQQSKHLTKSGAPDKRYAENQHLTKSGAPDKRYSDNQHLKKDGTKDMRYKSNQPDATKASAAPVTAKPGQGKTATTKKKP